MNPVAKRVFTGLTIGAAVVAALLFAPLPCFPWALGVLALLVFGEFRALLMRKVASSGARFTMRHALLLLVGALAIACCFVSLALIALRHGNLMLFYIIAIVKLSDTGGFAFGLTSAKLLPNGNHKLCPSISPGKSWEGLAGSVILSLVVSLTFMPITHFALPKALAFGCVAALVGTLGDLVESRFKRWVGVKDSSTLAITNGMGGLLDMFDSLLFVPAILLPFI